MIATLTYTLVLTLIFIFKKGYIRQHNLLYYPKKGLLNKKRYRSNHLFSFFFIFLIPLSFSSL
jgi:hypothetical protein